MRNRFWGMNSVGALVLVVVSTSTFVAQRTSNRPAAEPAPAATDLKITHALDGCDDVADSRGPAPD